ncbi:LOW QUALITY PROTEIN: long-chain-fatty-acid--CoA ligase 4-like [Eurytemora carolleeae]|uniref:LOW QUALITY PROTEIN: long-chain-fatty-acid--CoA ligase 4-like n=1 Tax=Eurytemora carolleeae TaxID=1294199 RepID=UPI000C77BD8F|nr:LOW QUALITY PROTEIN: long-chain-fatty-acid--CoA ligase 4-like [Eurytemora carolleeae]|eukprot:XP_023343813.1 LOW QUALITY PROTEIN: long-chain-fatty-acid--CoA ligase 4-like [Eurytemora affinis]
MGVLGEGVLYILKGLIYIYDIISFPIYYSVQAPWIRLEEFKMKRSEVVTASTTEYTIRSPHKMTPALQELINAGVDTMAKCFQFGLEKYSHQRCLGTRQLLDEEDECQPNGKMFKKWKLGDYTWQSYVDVDNLSTYLGKGLRELGQKHLQNICIFADTKAEWMITAQACFKQTFPVVTLYTNLGDDAVIHGINQTEVEIVVTTFDLLPRFKQILHRTPLVKCLVVIEDQLHQFQKDGFREGINIIAFKEVVELGKTSKFVAVNPVPSDPAIIMYTSGSTGIPKGVVLPHSALVATVRAFHFVVNPVKPGDIYLGYLPLAHILELLSENTMMVQGAPIGKLNIPNTMMVQGAPIGKLNIPNTGCSGDCSVLHPTLMCAVPLILDRIFKGIQENINKKGPFFTALFEFAHKYKLKCLRRGFKTPLLDFFIFRNVRALVGGKIRVMLSGGAPLSQETHEYIRVCLSVPLVQGYGLTESCACACIMDDTQISTGGVGPPLQGVQIKLINWEEGGYRVTDSQPRGEIVIGGGNVAIGYYKMPEKTAEDFYTDSTGMRWFKTGDIGQIDDDGTVRIIDRKKDLVKLQFGEYISLGKVESELKTCPLVENCCVYGDPSQSYVVALIVPDRLRLEALAEKLEIKNVEFEALCENVTMIGAVLRELQSHGKRVGLEKWEMPGAVTLCQDLWTPESGLVTAAFKLKRKPIQDFYSKDLKRMYGARCA